MTSLVEITEQDKRIAARVDSTIANGVDVAGGLRFANAGQVMEFSKLMSVSEVGVRKHLRGNPGACLAVVVQALEWKMSPYAVANKSYLVNDQIAWESQLIQAVILSRAPIKGRIKFRFEGEGPARKCFASATLADGTGDVDYESPAFKDIKPKNSPLWTADPDQQHCYYSGRALCRRHFPDVLLGVYDADELIGGEPMGTGRTVDVTPVRPRLAASLDKLGAAPAAAEPAGDEDAIDGDGPMYVDQETGEVRPMRRTDDPRASVDYTDGDGRRVTHGKDGSVTVGAKPSETAQDAPTEAPGPETAETAPEATGGQETKAATLSDDPIERAWQRGRLAKEQGKTLNAIPPEVAGDEAQRAAWRRGHKGEAL